MFVVTWDIDRDVSTSYALPFVSRRSNAIGGLRSPLFRRVLVFREVWLRVVLSAASSVVSLSGWTTKTGLHRTIAKPRFMIGGITTTANMLLSVFSDKVYIAWNICVLFLCNIYGINSTSGREFLFLSW